MKDQVYILYYVICGIYTHYIYIVYRLCNISHIYVMYYIIYVTYIHEALAMCTLLFNPHKNNDHIYLIR